MSKRKVLTTERPHSYYSCYNIIGIRQYCQLKQEILRHKGFIVKIPSERLLAHRPVDINPTPIIASDKRDFLSIPSNRKFQLG